jgi:hypothetical protein
VDWKVTAQDGRLSSIQHEGRQILMDQTEIGISKTIQLTEDVFQLALR